MTDEEQKLVADLTQQRDEAIETVQRQRFVIRNFRSATRRGDLILTREPLGRERVEQIFNESDKLLGLTRSGEEKTTEGERL